MSDGAARVSKIGKRLIYLQVVPSHFPLSQFASDVHLVETGKVVSVPLRSHSDESEKADVRGPKIPTVETAGRKVLDTFRRRGD